MVSTPPIAKFVLRWVVMLLGLHVVDNLADDPPCAEMRCVPEGQILLPSCKGGASGPACSWAAAGGQCWECGPRVAPVRQGVGSAVGWEILGFRV